VNYLYDVATIGKKKGKVEEEEKIISAGTKELWCFRFFDEGRGKEGGSGPRFADKGGGRSPGEREISQMKNALPDPQGKRKRKSEKTRLIRRSDSIRGGFLRYPRK